MARGKAWKAEEVDYIIENYKKVDNAVIAEVLGRSEKSIEGKIQSMKYKGLLPLEKISKLKSISNTVDIENSKLKVGKKYDVLILKLGTNKIEREFKGVLIQETVRHITLRCDKGYCENFMKADILRGAIKIGG